MDPQEELNKLIKDFLDVARESAMPIAEDQITGKILPPPHNRPKSIPEGKKAVYVFMADGRCLKVGKVGSNSQARFTSQHYNPWSSGSNLAKSILKSRDSLKADLQQRLHNEIDGISEQNVGAWIEENTARYHIFINAELDDLVLSLLEVFVQCRLKPLFER